MDYAFDAEFMVRLAFAEELPELLPDDFLAVRSVHPEQKTYEMANSWPEIHRFVDIYSPAADPAGEDPDADLPHDESEGLGPLADHAADDPLRARPAEAPGDHADADLGAATCSSTCPERWRPPIRTRDRLAKRRPMEGHPDARRRPLLSPIGLEPVINDPGPEAAPQWPHLEPAGARSGGFDAD